MKSQTALKLLQIMTDDLQAQEAVFQPTSFWSQAASDIYADLSTHGFQNFRSLPSSLHYFVPTYGPPGNSLLDTEAQRIEKVILTSAKNQTKKHSKKHSMLMHMIKGEASALADYRVSMAGDVLSQTPNLTMVSESKVGNPLEHFCFEDRWFSRSFLNYILGIIFLKKHIQTASIKRVIEVGGGFGTLGEILLQAGEYAYVDVDIPPTGAVASYYLANQPEANLISYAETRDADSIPFPEPGTQLVLCPWQLPRLHGAADLFVNFISFQEMEPHIVKNYLYHIDRLQCRFVLLRNLREGKQKKSAEVTVGVETPILGNDYDRFMANYRLIATNVIPYGFRTIDGFNSELRLYKRCE